MGKKETSNCDGDEYMKPVVLETCINCGDMLTDNEREDYWNGPRCCDGWMCGCRGLPIDPPYCEKCSGGKTDEQGCQETESD